MKLESTPDIQTTESAQTNQVSIAPGEIVIGTLVEINKLGEPCVDFPENDTLNPLAAISTLGISNGHIGKQVALLFANGDFKNPVIMGIIHNPLHAMLDSFEQTEYSNKNNEQIDLSNSEVSLESDITPDDLLIDGNKITFEAKDEIVLKCGESSITMTKAGKILIRGKYLLNRSTGVNRILGGSVQVN